MSPSGATAETVAALLRKKLDAVHRRADRSFVWILTVQWIAGVAIAYEIAPHAWASSRSVHPHLVAAMVLGAVVNAVPIWLALERPGWRVTRHAIAVAQMLWSALLIHLSAGRIETHFHVFVSLAFLAAYRDESVLVTATVVVVADLLLRGSFWPESVYGIATPERWRVLEHAAWVVFEDVILIVGCRQGVNDLRAASEHEVRLEDLARGIEARVVERTAELEASRERFRTLAEGTSAVPWDLDPESGVFEYIGPQVAPLGYPMERWREPGFYLESIFPNDRGAARDALAGIVEHGGRTQFEYRLLAANGTPIWVRTFVGTYTRPDGRAGLRGVSIDVSEHKALEVELRQAQKLESVGRLASGIAHEINTPTQFVTDNVYYARESLKDLLALVDDYRRSLAQTVDGTTQGVLEAMRRREQEIDFPYLVENLPSAIDRSLEGLERIATIVRSMKEFAHPDQRERVATDLNRAVSSTITIARNEYKYVADVVTELGELPPVPCFVGELNQVMLNMVVNAAHAIAARCGEGEARGTIRIRTFCDKGSAAVEISDDGVGIPESIRERIFDPFFTTKEVGKGTGQGLAIARSVTEKHGGRIECASEVGKGTTFTLWLPLEIGGVVCSEALAQGGVGA